MKEFKNFDDLAVYTINLFSKLFKNHAVLKGGMVLKILGSERNTNDLDYTFIPYRSKKDIKDFIYDELVKEFSNVKIEIHSTCIRLYIIESGIKLQIEINVDSECKTIDLSTSGLSQSYNQKSTIIRVMSFDVALSHKIAAWNERSLYRDLYDIYFFVSILAEKPDIDLLRKRLLSVKNKNKSTHMSMKELILKLRNISSTISFNEVAKELSDYLPKNDLPGLDKKIITALSRLTDYLEKFT